jgi:hypothetical protein
MRTNRSGQQAQRIGSEKLLYRQGLFFILKEHHRRHHERSTYKTSYSVLTTFELVLSGQVGINW